ncbi:Leucine-rich receptor-like protein kinase family protein [Rhynchospora pubera]|uniref:non-specific serine/threonine protein kinase n=1 Tax=Rhynchospora pubera TaxID=906938 RepID=A0AAV8F880_9POAL|nr:Leucine-rich receptor-like protein kinase family protein [Rhynchospora pubera]
MIIPKIFQSLFSFFYFHIFFFLCTSPITLGSLLSFYTSLPIESQNLLKWNYTSISESPCNLTGVTCSSFSPFPIISLNFSGIGLTGQLATSVPHLCSLPHIKSLDLSSNNFTGPIPSELFNCSTLETIHLEENFLSGPIPTTIFWSRHLATVNIGSNSLTGMIPIPQVEVRPMLQLEYLALYENSFAGEIPNELLQLPNLKFLYLYGNNLTGPIPNFPPHCNLIELYIYENNLSGNIPPSLRNCRKLTSFDASTNKIEGTLANETFCMLHQLELLYLEKNSLTGTLPSCLWNLPNLSEIYLSSNNFNGVIPQEIGMCQSLVELSLWGNQLTGSIPDSVGNLTSLELLVLARNSLSGSLPGSIGKCSSLVEIQLQENNLSGQIPREICDLGVLQKMYLFKNKIGGYIPREIWKLHSLKEFQLYNNSLIGEIPSEITLLKQLNSISLAYNNLTGEVPYFLGNTSNTGLVSIDLTGNSFYGPIPPYLCSNGSLEILDLGYNRFNTVSFGSIFSCSSLTRIILRDNQLRGSLPACTFPTSAISYFDLSNNFLDGQIPKEIGSWKNLTKLDLSNNLFSGAIPTELGTITNIEMINLSSNRLVGSIPHELGHCKKLLLLDLSQNFLSGHIPITVLTLITLQHLLLQNNKLTGSIPNLFSADQGLLELLLGKNLLDGSIPSSLGNLQYIYLGLNISMNNFTGQIPSNLGNLDKLQVLDLSHNSLSGQIPSSLNKMVSLSSVNLSFNRLSGDIPKNWGKFVILSPGSFSGNENLNLQNLNHNFSKSINKQNDRAKRELVALVVVLGASILLAGFCVAKYAALTRARTRSISSRRLLSGSTNSTDELPEDLTYDDIMRATDNLSEKFVIGRGRHGTVYCTEFGEGKKWAVKLVDLSQSRFCVEMQVLASIKHRNLVRMSGYCIRDAIGLILCEYVPVGTLFEILHQRTPIVALGWRTRYKISLGVAQALAYLHHDCMPMVVHRDVKSSNVLLDFDLEPKLADFGLARFVEVESDSSNTVSAIVGTLGYIAPENGYATKINEKCDVYSYGVMLLELLCRKMPVDPRFGDGVDIVKWVNLNLNQVDNFSIMNCLDEEIWYWEVDEREKALQLLELALLCTRFERETRPTMREIVNALIKIDR